MACGVGGGDVVGGGVGFGSGARVHVGGVRARERVRMRECEEAGVVRVLGLLVDVWTFYQGIYEVEPAVGSGYAPAGGDWAQKRGGDVGGHGGRLLPVNVSRRLGKPIRCGRCWWIYRSVL